MVFRKRVNRVIKRRVAKKKAPLRVRAAHSLTKLQKKEVRILAKGPEEVKYISEVIANDVKYNSLIGEVVTGVTVNDWHRAIPLVNQGGSSNTRIGRQISPTRCTLNIHLKFAQEQPNTRDVFAVFYMLTPKCAVTYPDTNQRPTYPDPTHTYNFLDNGDATDGKFTGTWLDSQKPINKDGFNLHAKRIVRLAKSSGSSNGSGVIGVDSGDGMYCTPSPSYVQNFSLKVPVPKTMKFDGESRQVPSNAGPVFGVGYYYADGTAADTGLFGLLYMTAVTHLWYKDA